MPITGYEAAFWCGRVQRRIIYDRPVDKRSADEGADLSPVDGGPRWHDHHGAASDTPVGEVSAADHCSIEEGQQLTGHPTDRRQIGYAVAGPRRKTVRASGLRRTANVIFQ